MSTELTNLIVKTFVQRRDVKAIQHNDGSYEPDRTPWTRSDFERHISGEASFGHYMLDQDDKCKLFAFDVDLLDDGFLPTQPFPAVGSSDQEVENWFETFVPCNPREAWLNRAHPARGWMKYQMRMIAGTLAAVIHQELELATAVAYSGSKGVHVYGFTGSISAIDAREGAEIVLLATGDWQLSRGKNFFKHRDQSILTGYPNFSVEAFPKQGSLDGKDLGNLMRLPLGRNRKSKDPTFFVDLTAPMADLKPVEPVWALTTKNAWSDPRA